MQINFCISLTVVLVLSLLQLKYMHKDAKCSQVAVLRTRLVDGDSIHVAVVHEPDDLIREQLSVVLAR